MINLDVATATCVMGVLLIVLGLMFQGNWREGEAFAPSRHWALAAILCGAGSLLIAFRAQLPPVLSVVAANSIIVVGVVLMHRGVALFTGTRPLDRWYGAATLFVVAVFSWYTFVSPDVNARIVVISLMRVPFFLHAMWLLWRAKRQGGSRLLIWVLGASTLWFALRAGVTGLGSQPIADFLKAGSFQAFNFFVSGITGVLMVAAQYRLEAEQVRQALAAEAGNLRLARDHLEAVVAERTAELTRSNAELEQFAYVASHDLRQPLRMVSSYITLLERRLGGRLDEEEKSFLAFVTDGAKRMDALIVALLDYSRIGRNRHVAEPVALDQALADALSNLAVSIGESGAEITVPDHLPEVMGDRMDFVRLFQNLIGNAIKYVAPGVAPKVVVDWRDEGASWLVRVSDNGIGIAPEDAERAFRVFQRLVTSEEYDGCGIGLAVCRKIAEHVGGTIWEEAALGGGCCFNLRLPKSAPIPLARAC